MGHVSNANFGDLIFGYYLKDKWTCDYFGLSYESADISIMKNKNHTSRFLARKSVRASSPHGTR